MMPITLMNVGDKAIIRKISGNSELRQHCADLGFVVGGDITVVNVINGNLIVNVKDARIAISKEMAMKIMV